MRIEGRLALLGDVAGGDDHLAVALHLGEHRIPDEGRVDVAALPGSRDLRRTHVEDLHILGIDLGVGQRGQQLIVGGRHEGRRDLLALQVGQAVHARAVAGDQLLGVADVVQQPDHLHVHALAGSRRRRARADLADRHLAGRHGLDDVATAAEHLPVDLVAGRLLELALGHEHPEGDDHVLVGERHLLGLRHCSRNRQTECQDGSGLRNEQGSSGALHMVLSV